MPLHPADAASSRPRRSYAEARAVASDGGFALQVDGRGARTPAGRPLLLPTEALGRSVAAEWAAQGERIDAAAMPLTRLAATALDRTPGHRAEVGAEVAGYADADLLCYFAEAPRALVERQAQGWGPMLDWAERELGLRLMRAQGVVHRAQPRESLHRAEALAAALGDFELTGLAFAAALFGSAVLAFAVQRGVLAGAAAFALSRLDEAFQEEQWGVDHEAALRTEALGREAETVGRWFGDLRD